MTFTAGVFLFGTLFGLIPIIIHLIYRRQSRIVEFPSLMFFRFISKRVARRQNIRELIILFLRFLTIALIAFVLANPIISLFGYKGGDSTSVLIIVDDSYSMQAIKDNESVFEQAKRKAFNILSTLEAGDNAEILFLSELSKNSKTHVLTKDIDNLKQEVLSAKVSNHSSSVSTAFVEISKLLNASSFPNKECYFISDFREPVLRDFDTTNKTFNNVSFFNVLLEVDEFSSFAITNIEAFDNVLIPNSSTKVRVDISNFAGIESQLYVSLHLQTSQGIEYAKKPKIQTISFEKNEFEKSLFFDISSADFDVIAGFVTLDFQGKILNDDLQIDNKRYFSIDVRDKEPILVVNGEPNEINFDDEVCYLVAALQAEGENSIYKPIVVLENEIDFGRLDDYSAIFFCNANLQSNDANELEKLQNFVKEGGIIVFFPGDRILGKDFNDFFIRNKPENSILPASLIDIKSSQGIEKSFKLDKLPENHQLFQNLDTIDESLIIFSDYWLLNTAESNVDSNILSRFKNGDTFLCSKATGIGKVYLFAVPADREWSNFAPRKLFPILIHRILNQKKNIANTIEPEMSYHKLISGKLGKAQIVVYPSTFCDFTDSKITPKPIYFTSSGKEHNSIDFPAFGNTQIENSTQNPGIYFYKINPSSDNSRFSAFTVNVNTIEATSKILTPAQIQKKIVKSQFISAETDIIEFIKKRREGTSIWLILALCCLIVFVVESILANQKLSGVTSDKAPSIINKLKKANIKIESGKN